MPAPPPRRPPSPTPPPRPAAKPPAPPKEAAPDLPSFNLELEVDQAERAKQAVFSSDNIQELELDFQSAAAPAAEAVAHATAPVDAREIEFTLEEEPEPEAAPPLQEPEKSEDDAAFAALAGLAMQGGMEVVGMYDDFNAGEHFQKSSTAPYTGLALEAKNLFSPLEELLHAQGGGEGIALESEGAAVVYARFTDELVALLDKNGALPLFVTPESLACQERPVFTEIGDARAGLYKLYAAGVQSMTLVRGMDRAEATTLARFLVEPAPEDGVKNAAVSDVSAFFWAKGLTHVRLAILETFIEVDPPPEGALPPAEIIDQSVEQLERIRSKVLSTIPGISAAGGQTKDFQVVRSLAFTADDLAALERDIFQVGAQLIGPRLQRSATPFPGATEAARLRLGELHAGNLAEAREQPAPSKAEGSSEHPALAREADLELRLVEALFRTLPQLRSKDAAEAAAVRLLAWPARRFREGDLRRGLGFMKSIRQWAEAGAKGGEGLENVVDLCYLQACSPELLDPLLRQFPSLQGAHYEACVQLFDSLPSPVLAALARSVMLRAADPRLLLYFDTRLERDRGELERRLFELKPERIVDLIQGLAVRAPAALPGLLRRAVEHAEAEVRSAVARASGALESQDAETILRTLSHDDDPSVRQEVAAAVERRSGDEKVAAMLWDVAKSRVTAEWTFAEKRLYVLAAAHALGEAGRPKLKELLTLKNPLQLRHVWLTQAAAALALGFVGGEEEKAQLHHAAKNPRLKKVLAESLLWAAEHVGRVQTDGWEHLVSNMDHHFAPYDRNDVDEVDEARAGEEREVTRLSSAALKKMRIDDLLEAPGDQVQILGGELVRALGEMISLALEERMKTEFFAVALGRASALATALCDEVRGAASLVTFAGNFFVNGRRLRLSRAQHRAALPLVEKLAVVRVQEILLADRATRGDLLEVLYAVLMALKAPREMWLALQRDFPKIQLKELSLIRESWRRKKSVTVDARCNAVRLFAAVYLWLEDVAARPDNADLLPERADRIVRQLAEAEEEGLALLPGLIGVKENRGDAALLAAHSVLLATCFARWLGADRLQLAEIVRCALYRDLGLLTLPPGLLTDLGAEGASEAAELARVPCESLARVVSAERKGEELLLQAVVAYEALPRTQVPMAREEPYIRPRQPLFHSRLLAVTERYTLYTSALPARREIPPDEAALRMLRDPNLDPGLVRSFCNMVGLFPVGSFVELADGRRGVVLSAPLDVASRDQATVRVVAGPDGRPLPRPETTIVLGQVIHRVVEQHEERAQAPVAAFFL